MGHGDSHSASGVSSDKVDIRSFRDLEVYQMLCELHLQVCKLTSTFPAFERYELGSQLRGSSNSAPANLAEGWSNRHIAIYMEGVTRSLGELRETLHHLYIAYRKGYLSEQDHEDLTARYERYGRMLKELERALVSKRGRPQRGTEPQAGEHLPHDPWPMTRDHA